MTAGASFVALPRGLYRGHDGDFYDSDTGRFLFSPNFELHQSNVVMTTRDNTTWVSALVGVTEELPAGLYAIDVSLGYNGDATGSDVRAQFLLDGSYPGAWAGDLIRQEMKDVGGNVSDTMSAQAFATSRRFYRPLSGMHTVEVRFRPESNNQEASVWDIEVGIQRVK